MIQSLAVAKLQWETFPSLAVEKNTAKILRRE